MRLTSLLNTAIFSFSVLGCSAAPDPVAKGSAQYVIDNPQQAIIDQPEYDNFSDCSFDSTGGIGLGDSNVPDLPSGTRPPEEFGVEIANGQIPNDGDTPYEIECEVSGTKSFTVNVKMSGPNVSPARAGSLGETAVEISGNINAEGYGNAFVAARTTVSGAVESRANAPCELHAVPDPEAEGDFLVSEGQAKFTFICRETTSVFDDFSLCETRGTISVSDCITETK